MLEKYAQLKIFFEYKLPFIVLGIIVAIMIILSIVGKIIDAWEKKQKNAAARQNKGKKTKITKNTVKEIAVSQYMPSNYQQLRIKVSFKNRVFFLLRGFKHTFYIPDSVIRKLY